MEASWRLPINKGYFGSNPGLTPSSRENVPEVADRKLYRCLAKLTRQLDLPVRFPTRGVLHTNCRFAKEMSSVEDCENYPVGILRKP